MKLFFKVLGIFSVVGVLLGEAAVRLFDLTIDVPTAYVGRDSLIHFDPGQKGKFLGGDHKWHINRFGNYGPEPYSLDSLVTVIGDSFISNIMNPPECHQAVFLDCYSDGLNFFPRSRSGASFLEYLEMARSLEPLNPLAQLLYVHDHNFTMSLAAEGSMFNTVQISLETMKKSYPTLQHSRLKKGIYQFKFFYFLYRTFLSSHTGWDEIAPQTDPARLELELVRRLISYTYDSYDPARIVLVFSPGSDPELVRTCKQAGYKILELQAHGEDWLLPDDGHWSCRGHQNAARQVGRYLRRHLN